MSFNRQTLVDMGYEDAVLLDPPFLDEAIIGMSHDDRVIYDYDLLLKAFTEHGNMTLDEAVEWIDYNTIRSLSYQTNGPIVMFSLKDL